MSKEYFRSLEGRQEVWRAVTAGSTDKYIVLTRQGKEVREGDPAADPQTWYKNRATPSLYTPPIESGITYDPPLTITQGGTYTGAWQSMDNRSIPAVTIDTTQPVTIINSHARGRGDLFRCRRTGARVSLINNYGEGFNSGVLNMPQGRFADLQGLISSVVQHNHIKGTGGIYFNGYVGDAVNDTFLVRYNYAHNINGQWSDGNGGYKTGSQDFTRYQIVQFNHVKGIPGARIDWNRTYNEPYLSHIEDTINMYDTFGKSDSDRILIQNNLLYGAYAWDPAESFTGSGIAMCDGNGAFMTAQYNTVLETSNAGIFISDGNDASIISNVVLGRGRLADGTLTDAATDAGIYVRDYQPSTPRRPESCIVTLNDVGWGSPTASNANGRNDISIQNLAGTSTPSGNSFNNSTRPAGPISQAAIDAALAAHLDRASQLGIIFGRIPF